jgi:hypothetical protein
MAKSRNVEIYEVFVFMLYAVCAKSMHVQFQVEVFSADL